MLIEKKNTKTMLTDTISCTLGKNSIWHYCLRWTEYGNQQ